MSLVPKLSILICTLPSRIFTFAGLITRLKHQVEGLPVELLWLGDNKNMSVGLKRNHLLHTATGEYTCYIDDDDHVPPNYVSAILKAAEFNPDVIAFDAEISENDGPWKRVVYDKDFPGDRNFPDHYERWPNHLTPVKRGIALSVGFPNKSSHEDFDFAKGIHELIKTQVRIPEILYYYDYSSERSETPR